MSKRYGGSEPTPKLCPSVSPKGDVRCRLATGHPNIHIGNGPGGTSVWWLNEDVPAKVVSLMAAKKKTARKAKTRDFEVTFTVRVLDNKAANPSDIDEAVAEVVDTEIMTTRGKKQATGKVRFIDAFGFDVREVSGG